MYGPQADPIGQLGSGMVQNRYAPVTPDNLDQRVPMTPEEMLELVRAIVSGPTKKPE